MMTRVALFSAVYVFALTACHMGTEESVAHQQHSIQGTDDYQGPHLLGENYQITSSHYLHGTLQNVPITLQDGHLAVSGVPVDPSLASVPDIPASDGGKLRILAAFNTGGSMYEYVIEHEDITNNKRDLCGGQKAIPVWGRWHENGDNDRTSNRQRVSFACEDSAVFKCQFWGWSSWDQPLQHHACTRMARNDFCGDGSSHTMTGTMIRQYDANETGVNPFDENSTVFGTEPDAFGDWLMPPPMYAGELAVDTRYFEAGWTSSVTMLKRRTVYSGQAVCLSKLRWQSMPVGGMCPANLPDPRASEGGYFCEDYSNISDLEISAGALLVNESFYNDVPLLRWDLSGFSYTTAFSDYQTDPNGHFGSPIANEGIVFTENGYNALIASGDFVATDFSPLKSWLDPSGGTRKYATTVTSMPSPYMVHRLEGYVINNLTAAQRFESKSDVTLDSLYMYFDGITHVTTTAPPWGSAPVFQGYVFRW